MPDTLTTLIAATRRALQALETGDGGDTKAVYATLERTYAIHGLDANVAESSIDWLEGGTLTEDLTEALDKLPTADDIVRMWGGR